MISPTKKLREFIELYANRANLCDRIEIDNSMLSRILKGERGASAKVMERMCTFINWPLSEAWEIIEGETEE